MAQRAHLLPSQLILVAIGSPFMFMLESSSLPLWPLLAVALALLAPAGLGLISTDEDNFADGGLVLLLAPLLTLIGYAATGFALHFGGIGIIIDHPDLASLVWEWTPLKEGNLQFWGVAGWMGFGMAQVQSPLAGLLFLAALPLAMTSSLLTMITLGKQSSATLGIIFAALTALLLAPLTGNWTQGGGWLMHLGQSMGAGDGYIDFGGASFFLLAGGVALAALLAWRRSRPADSISANGKWAVLGLGLLVSASVGWNIASPLHLWNGSSPEQSVLHSLLALAAGGLIGMAYSWFALGEPDAIWTVRSAAAGWVAALAASPWMTPPQAMLLGAVAAWLFIIAAWLMRELLGWYDPGDIFSVFGLPSIFGLLTVGIFAPADGQFRAQLIGSVSIFLLGFFAASLYLLLQLGLKKLLGNKEIAE